MISWTNNNYVWFRTLKPKIFRRTPKFWGLSCRSKACLDDPCPPRRLSEKVKTFSKKSNTNYHRKWREMTLNASQPENHFCAQKMHFHRILHNGFAFLIAPQYLAVFFHCIFIGLYFTRNG